MSTWPQTGSVKGLIANGLGHENPKTDTPDYLLVYGNAKKNKARIGNSLRAGWPTCDTEEKQIKLKEIPK